MPTLNRWNIFGPLGRLEDLDADAPALAFDEIETTTSLPDDLRPTDDRTAFYLLRHRDEDGRSEAGTLCVSAAQVDGRAVPPPLAPVWPGVEGWPVRAEGSVVRLLVLWERSVRLARVVSIELQSQTNSDSPQTVQTVTPAPATDRLELAVAVPSQPTRFNWRVISPQEATLESPWSARVSAGATPGLSLQLVEVLS